MTTDRRKLGGQIFVAPDGRLLTALTYSTPRPNGRRIELWDDGVKLFDTDDCFDEANAANRLEGWIAANLKLATAEAV